MELLCFSKACNKPQSDSLRAVENGGKGVQSTQARAPFGGSRCCCTQHGLVLAATRFVLAQAFRACHQHGDGN